MELKGWCITKGTGGWVNNSTTHNFLPYTTLFLKRPMYYCNCGMKIKPEQYIKYSEYLIKRRKAIDAYMRNLK